MTNVRLGTGYVWVYGQGAHAFASSEYRSVIGVWMDAHLRIAHLYWPLGIATA